MFRTFPRPGYPTVYLLTFTLINFHEDERCIFRHSFLSIWLPEVYLIGAVDQGNGNFLFIDQISSNYTSAAVLSVD